MFDRRLVQNFDYLLLALVLLITGMGIVNLYSAGFNRGGHPLYIKQMYFLAVGLGLMVLTLFYDYRHLEKLGYPIYILSILLLVAVMVAGKTVYGSRRWLLWGRSPSSRRKWPRSGLSWRWPLTSTAGPGWSPWASRTWCFRGCWCWCRWP